MHSILKSKTLFWVVTLIYSVQLSCKQTDVGITDAIVLPQSESKIEPLQTPLSNAFKDYWYAGNGEITSYKLEQARYGEIRNGKAVLIYVTEDFLPDTQVKADNYSKTNIPILKLNTTKSFNTGIYPYSIMQSTFYPISNNQHALKVSASIQEWCGHVFTQLNNRDGFEIKSHSYFQNEADQSYKIEKVWTENELWVKLRIDPNSLPIGDIDIVPSLDYTRLKHKPVKAYKATANIKDGEYMISYPHLNRTLKIQFNTKFPYDILGWEDTYLSGFGNDAKVLTTKATKLKTLKTAYWNKNSNVDEKLGALLN